MYSLVQKIKKKEKNKRILVLGLDNSGKTTFLYNLLHIQKPIEPTFGFQILSEDIDGYHVNFWDIGGQSSIRIFWKNYFEDVVDGIIWIIDSSDLNRLTLAKDELHSVVKSDLFCPILVVANKQDLEEAKSSADIDSFLRLGPISHKVIECSALEDDPPLNDVSWLLNQNVVLPWNTKK
eukprot:NODE_221_length_12388_cov_2.350883.p9 type:complete len:179 gc:universal NODE_221_length_12388_cov_2.350883:10884-10348(-)